MVAESDAQFTIPAEKMTVENSLPTDWQQANLVGRVMVPNVGPTVVYVRDDGNVVDITSSYPTTSDLFEQENPAEAARRASFSGKSLGNVKDILDNSSVRDPSKPYMLSPADFQEIEAAGVTFVQSLVERMVEEASMKEATSEGSAPSPEALDGIRQRIRKEVIEVVGTEDFSTIVPGSAQALKILENMEKRGLSMIYPRVGLGAEGEIFSKASVGTSVGHGAQAGYSPGASPWVNPEPEVVLFANSKGKTIGAAHGNDVNDRKKEGYSALLLHRAKVKNGSTSIGPFVRLFDDNFGMHDIKQLEVGLEVTRADGSLKYKGANNMQKISRQPEDIMAAACDSEREHPAGVAVFLGTMTIPLKDDKGADFTHEPGDVVTMGSPKLGHLTNVMLPADRVQGLEKGALSLARNLAERGLLLNGQQKTIQPLPGWKTGL